MDEVVKSPKRPTAGPKVSRRERAAATRRRILAAAEAEFVTKTYHAALMSDIAKRAGVSVQMIYFSFGTKAKLLGAIIENAVLGEEAPVEPLKSDWYERVKQASTAVEAIRWFIIGSGRIFERASAVAMVGAAGRATDPELDRISRAGDELRAANYRSVIELAATLGPLQPGLDIQTASDVLVAVFSPALYMEFINDCGWSHEQTMQWLADTVPGLICAGEAPQERN
jgi:AcrR family transcriptional regulator